MFDVGFPELILIAVVGLLVIGPERLPETLRTIGLWLGRMRRSFAKIKSEIENEIGMDEVRRQLHNESVMDEMKRIEAEVRNTADETRNSLNKATIHTTPHHSSPEEPYPAEPEPLDPELENPAQTNLELSSQTETPGEPTDNAEVADQVANQKPEQPENQQPPASKANG